MVVVRLLGNSRDHRKFSGVNPFHDVSRRKFCNFGGIGKTTTMTTGTFSLLLLVTTMYFHNFLLLLVTNFDRLWARPRLCGMFALPVQVG